MEKGRKGKEEEQDNITDNTYRTLYTSTFPIPTHTAKQIPPTGLRGGRERERQRQRQRDRDRERGRERERERERQRETERDKERERERERDRERKL